MSEEITIVGRSFGRKVRTGKSGQPCFDTSKHGCPDLFPEKEGGGLYLASIARTAGKARSPH